MLWGMYVPAMVKIELRKARWVQHGSSWPPWRESDEGSGSCSHGRWHMTHCPSTLASHRSLPHQFCHNSGLMPAPQVFIRFVSWKKAKLCNSILLERAYLESQAHFPSLLRYQTTAPNASIQGADTRLCILFQYALFLFSVIYLLRLDDSLSPITGGFGKGYRPFISVLPSPVQLLDPMNIGQPSQTPAQLQVECLPRAGSRIAIC